MKEQIENGATFESGTGQKTAPVEKKPYRSPRIVVYGDLRRVTMGVGGSASDLPSPGNSKSG